MERFDAFGADPSEGLCPSEPPRDILKLANGVGSFATMRARDD